MTVIFKEKILYKYDVFYYKCNGCDFIQTEKPFWLNEAYASPINTSDIGLIHRNILFSNVIPAILDMCSTSNDSYLDFAGGYGIFVRIMRDKGYDFYLQDLYTPNFFAKNFELKDYRKECKFKALTAFEVFEHFENPVEQIAKMSVLSDILIFSTELQPKHVLTKGSDWWYISADTGQHISFYTMKSLKFIAKKFSFFLYSNGLNLHILSKECLVKDPFEVENRSSSKFGKFITELFYKKRNNEAVPARPSLLQADFEMIKKVEGANAMLR
jgi:hypothetical protein